MALLFWLGSWQSLVQAQTNCVPPSVTFTASSSAICQGQAVTLNAVANPTGTYSYTISAPNGVTLSATNSAVATATGLASGLNTFTVTVGTSQTCLTTATVSVNVGNLLSNVQITSVSCNSATNQYTVSGTVSLTTTQPNTLTITDGSVSTTVAVSNGISSVPFTLPAQASGATSHVIVASLPGCTTANVTANTTYTAPTSCSVASPQLTLSKLVSNSVANVSAVLTYTLVVSNVGSAAASNVTVTDSVSVGLRYVANTAPQGTTFTQGNPVSTWTIGTLGVGQSSSMTFQAIADSAGVLYNKARIPGTTATVCTSIPYHVCVGDSYQFTLTAPAGRTNYRWYRTANGMTTQLTSFTTNVLDVTAAGSYSLAVDNATGACQDFTCCPFVVIEDVIPTFSARTVPPTCNGATAQANGQLILSGFQADATYQYSSGDTFSPTASLSGGAQVIPTTGIIATTLANPTGAPTYTVRVFNAANCYTDVTVTLAPVTCSCPPTVCTSFVFKQSKGIARVQNRR